MPKFKSTHVRTKPVKDSALYCGGGRCTDQTALKSVAPKNAEQANCAKCRKAKRSADARG